MKPFVVKTLMGTHWSHSIVELVSKCLFCYQQRKLLALEMGRVLKFFPQTQRLLPVIKSESKTWLISTPAIGHDPGSVSCTTNYGGVDRRGFSSGEYLACGIRVWLMN